MTARKTEPGDVEVTVAGNYQVNHDGTLYGPGQTVRVPAELAAKWRAAGYVHPE